MVQLTVGLAQLDFEERALGDLQLLAGRADRTYKSSTLVSKLGNAIGPIISTNIQQM